jgi:hypothetical protein
MLLDFCAMKTTVQPVLAKHEIDVHSKEFERQIEHKKLQFLKKKLAATMVQPKQSSLFTRAS